MTIAPASAGMIAIPCSASGGSCRKAPRPCAGSCAMPARAIICTIRNPWPRRAEAERARILAAAQTLRDAGMACPVVSVGATPTALSARAYDGVTELRAGVYMFFDLVQAGIGVCGHRGHRAQRPCHRDRPPAGKELDHHRCRLDGAVVGPGHGGTGGRSILWPGVRSGGPALSRPGGPAREPGAWHHRGSARHRTRPFRRCASGIGCAFCRTMPAPPRRSTTNITSWTTRIWSPRPWPRFRGW